MVFLEIFAWTAFAWYVFVITLVALGWVVIRFINAKSIVHNEEVLAETLPGVSILRPLKGLDPHLYDCLESTFVQKYPKFEVILSVADETDPAVSVAKEIIVKYSDVDARIIIGRGVCF